MEKEIELTLEKGEEIVWEGKQDLKSSILVGLSGLLIFFIIGSIFYFVGTGSSGTCTINGQQKPASDCAGTFLYVFYGLVILGILTPIGSYMQYKVTHYVFTNKRILLKSGLIGADMRSIYYDQIKSSFVDVGIIGKIFGTGTIKIDTGRMTETKNGGSITEYDRLSNIKNPYELYGRLQSILSDRKEGLFSGRLDYENNQEKYKEFVQKQERIRRQA